MGGCIHLTDRTFAFFCFFSAHFYLFYWLLCSLFMFISILLVTLPFFMIFLLLKEMNLMAESTRHRYKDGEERDGEDENGEDDDDEGRGRRGGGGGDNDNDDDDDDGGDEGNDEYVKYRSNNGNGNIRNNDFNDSSQNNGNEDENGNENGKGRGGEIRGRDRDDDEDNNENNDEDEIKSSGAKRKSKNNKSQDKGNKICLFPLSLFLQFIPHCLIYFSPSFVHSLTLSFSVFSCSCFLVYSFHSLLIPSILLLYHFIYNTISLQISLII